MRTSPADDDRTFIERADAYAEAMADDPKRACVYVRQACRRHLDDRVRSRKKSARYEFSEAHVNRICRFAETQPHVKGEWAARGELIKLEDWQVFIYASVFGWIRLTDGLRRYRYAYCEIPRKSSKSTMLAIAGLYMATEDGEFGADVMCTATTEDQAMFVFRPAWEMTAKNHLFRNHYGIELGGTYKNPGPIFRQQTGSVFRAIIGLPRDGASPHMGIIDEYHEHKSDEVYQSIKTGMAARSQPILWVITTAGSDIGGPCYMLRQDMTKVLNSTMQDDETFAIMYTLDEGDDWTTEEALEKANPNLGVSVKREALRADQLRAIQSARLQNDFKMKHQNIWSGAKAGWMNMEAWRRQALPDLKLEDFAGQPCWLGIDLSERSDFTSLALIFRDMDLYYLFTRHYLPEATIMDPTKTNYQQWFYEGHLISIAGNVVDYDVVLEDILEWDKQFRIVAAGYDKRFAHQFAIDLVEHGINAVEVPQTYAVLTEPMADLEAGVLSGRVFHDDNPVTNWHMSNTVVQGLSRGTEAGMRPAKEAEDKKIDGVQAAITAMVMEHTQEVDVPSDWSQAGALVPIQ